MSLAISSEHGSGESGFSGLTSRFLSAFVLAAVAALSLWGGLSLWAALGGWAAYHTRGATLRDGAYNLACAVTGLGFGMVTQSVAAKLAPGLGMLALPAALLLAAIGMQLMKWITEVDNIPSYFLGVLVVFAAEMETSLDTYLILTAAVSVGALAAALSDIVCRAHGDREGATGKSIGY